MPKIYKIPVDSYPRTKSKNVKKYSKPVDPFAFSHEDRVLKKRIAEINKQMGTLKIERRECSIALKKREQLRNHNKERTVKLYALKLEDQCWYIGMSYDPIRRFVKHGTSKGAKWTKLHKPILIHETRETNLNIQDLAARLEDDMTLEYALKYGSDKVRGGGYCQFKPLWPDVIKDNE